MLNVKPEYQQRKVTTSLNKKPTKIMKPIPLKTVRSSKLAAMAANINKMAKADVDSNDDVTDTEDSDPLDFDLIIPDILNNDQYLEINKNVEETIASEKNNTTEQVFRSSNKNDDNGTTSSNSETNDRSLSCVNPSVMTNNSYRLGSK